MDATRGQAPDCRRDHDAPLARRDALVAQLALVDRITALVCRRRRLRADEAEEFSAHVRMKLVENDYGLLARCRDTGSLGTYLVTVIDRLFLDYRVTQWGRWRPSAHARRSGRIAILLDRLLTRDGFSFDEACHVLQTNYRVACSRDDLYAISVRLPCRPRKRAVCNSFDDLVAQYGDPEAALAQQEALRLALRCKAALELAIAQLAPEDRRLLEMRYRYGREIVAIAQELGIAPKPLYRRLDNIVRRLRRHVAVASPGRAEANCQDFHVADISISWE